MGELTKLWFTKLWLTELAKLWVDFLVHRSYL